MAEDSTKIIISLETVLKNLNRTLRGLDQIKKKLDSIAAVKASTQDTRASQAAQRLTLQQQKLNIQTQELANRQERARQTSERLLQSQQRLTRVQERLTQSARGLNVQQDAHVRVFRAMERASQSFNRTLAALGNSLRSVGQGLASFGATLSLSVSAPLAALTVNIVDAAVRMDSLRRGLITIAGSSQEAAVQLERLTEIAKLPGIGFEEAIQGSIALQAVGFSAKEAERALVQFSNAVALTGGSREQLQIVTVQLGQMAAQSKVLAADLKPIINAAPAVAVALRNAFGTVRSEEIQELGIQSKDFIDIMIKELGKLPRATAGARNSFDNFRDGVFRAAAVIGETLLPALVRLTEIIGPVITGLANAFAALPAPLQSTIIVLGAMTIAAGPLLFIFGQLLLGVGRLAVGLAQLNASGILPAVAGFNALSVSATGAATAVRGATVAVAAGTAALGGALVALVALVAAHVAISSLLTSATDKQTDSLENQIKSTEANLQNLRNLAAAMFKLTERYEEGVDVSKEFDAVYKQLNRDSQARVLVLRQEIGIYAALSLEIGRLIQVREREQEVQSALTASALLNAAERVRALDQQLSTAIQSIQVLRRQREALARTGDVVSAEGVSRLQQFDERIKSLADKLPDLNQQIQDANTELSKQNTLLQQLEERTGRSTQEILEQAKSFGLFRGDVNEAARGIEAFRTAQIQLEAALTGTTEEIIRQRLELRKLSGPADEAQRQRRILIDAAVDFARENSNTIDEAKKKLDEFAEKFPEVRKAIEDEIKKRPIEEFLRELTGRKGKGRDRSETSLRNAQQQLADAVIQVALASKEREVEIELDKNAALQRAAEVGQRLRIFSYREYLELRARLTTESLDKEIDQQKAVVRQTILAQARLLSAAQQAGIPAAERIRRQAQATQANEEQVRAETRLILLQNQRERVQAELTQELKLAQDQQLKDTIQLEIAFGDLQGRIQDAMDISAMEEFRESLQDLAKAQDFLNKQIEKAKKLRKAERVEELQRAQAANQRQIEVIQNTIKTRQALAELAAAEKLVENAKERQRALEADLAFQVQFRGLAEEESIRLRLEGEQRLQASMELSKSIVGDLQQRLVQLGITPPPELQKFVDGLRQELLGLGELTFVEQFRLAEKEFQRFDDERLRRIGDIERAIQNRNISEAEGLIFIRRINGEYVGDLERQLQLLKEIAAASGDASLQRQAQSAEETVKDAGDRLADFNQQLRSTSIDSLREGFVGLVRDLASGADNAKEALLNLLDTVAGRLLELAAENLFDKFVESVFGDGTFDPIGALKRLFGIGGDVAESAIDLGAEAVSHGAEAAVEHSAEVTAATASAAALTTGGTAAGAAMTAGGTAAGAALTTGGTTAAATLVTALTAAATAFATTVAAAGAAFAAAVAGSGISQALGGIGSAAGGGAATGLFPAVPGGAIRVLEGGYPEAILTTDPRHAARQVNILRELIAKTRGFYGHLPGFATGGMISRADAESHLLNSINRAPQFSPALPASAMETASGAAAMNLRIVNQMSSREVVRPYMASEEFVRDVLNVISTNSNEVVRRLPLRR